MEARGSSDEGSSSFWALFSSHQECGCVHELTLFSPVIKILLKQDVVC